MSGLLSPDSVYMFCIVYNYTIMVTICYYWYIPLTGQLPEWPQAMTDDSQLSCTRILDKYHSYKRDEASSAY